MTIIHSNNSTFGQLLQQTGILDQVRQSGRPHTLFVPTNAALQSMNNNYNPTQLKQVIHFLLSNTEKNHLTNVCLVCSSSHMR